MISRSESIGKLAAALAKAQGSGDREEEGRLLATLTRLTHPLRKRGRGDATALERFMEKIVGGSGECWYWRGALHKLGYGLSRLLGESKAHRVSWVLFRGAIPPGMSVLHRCDVRNCAV